MSPVNQFTTRPPTLLGVDDYYLRTEVQNFLSYIYQAHNALNGVTIQAPANNGGFSVQGGTATVTGSLSGIVTGLARVATVTASLNTGGSATNFTVTANPNKTAPGSIDIQVWMPTAAGNTTPIAATSAVSVHWYATGSAS